MDLLIGCGRSRRKIIVTHGARFAWENLVTVDENPDVKPDVCMNLTSIPLPFEDNHFEEIHAYHVLEHTGVQGDYRFFFRQWDDFWRMLKPGGLFCGIVPLVRSPWAWGDPGHTRIISMESLHFLNRNNYKATEVTAMTDYRNVYKGNFLLAGHYASLESLYFILEAIK